MNGKNMRILRMSEVEKITSLNKRTIYRYLQNNTFPRPVRMGPRLSGWLESDILAWVANLGDAVKSDHLEGDVWVTYSKDRSPMDVKVGDIMVGPSGQTVVRKVEIRE